jgi:probable biosynthetic protein (TIGR04098 family)
VWIGDLAACGRNVLDGRFALYRAGDARAGAWGAPDESSRARFVAAGIPVVRLSNIFVTRDVGPDRLRIGQPANADFSRIPDGEAAADGHERNRRARETGRFWDPPPGARASPAVTAEQAIDPDRDVNGVGLVYFGNFPAFFHVAERHALAALPAGGPGPALAARRGTLRRRIGLFANARADDRLRLRAECAVVPEPVGAGTPARPHGLVWFTVHVERCSDGRSIALTTAERVVPLSGPGEVDRWRACGRELA